MKTCQQCSNEAIGQDSQTYGMYEGLCMECYDEKYLRKCQECGDTFSSTYGEPFCPACEHVIGEREADIRDQMAESEIDN